MQGDSVLELKAGYVGRLRVLLPLARIATDSCTLQLDEILLTVGLKAKSLQPTTPAKAESSGGAAESSNSPVSGFFDFDEGPIKPSAITNGIAKIAGGMENILQKLKIQVQSSVLICVFQIEHSQAKLKNVVQVFLQPFILACV